MLLNTKKIVLLVVVTAAIAFAACWACCCGGPKIATVDVQKVVMASKEIATVNKERQNGVAILTAFIENAKVEIEKQKDATKRKELEEKFSQELNTQKETMDKDYVSKLSVLDKAITDQIASVAKKMGYKVVVSKAAIVSGGTDITDEVLKTVK